MEENEKKNKPATKQQVDFPLLLLGFLLVIVGILIYIGYGYLRDDTPRATLDALGDSTTVIPSEEARLASEEERESGKTKRQSEKAKEKPSAAKPKLTANTTPKKVTPAVAIPAGKTITHQVKAGETFNSIAKRYNLSKAVLKALNPQIKDEAKDMKSGVTKLKVRVKAVHTVGPGDVLSKVASKYGVSKALIMAANAKTRDFASRGENLIIPLDNKQ
ncbi:MAG: LysM peptidoglycan-binding domain-containing protein [Bacteroidota bacterium]